MEGNGVGVGLDPQRCLSQGVRERPTDRTTPRVRTPYPTRHHPLLDYPTPPPFRWRTPWIPRLPGPTREEDPSPQVKLTYRDDEGSFRSSRKVRSHKGRHSPLLTYGGGAGNIPSTLVLAFRESSPELRVTHLLVGSLDRLPLDPYPSRVTRSRSGPVGTRPQSLLTIRPNEGLGGKARVVSETCRTSHNVSPRSSLVVREPGVGSSLLYPLLLSFISHTYKSKERTTFGFGKK